MSNDRNHLFHETLIGGNLPIPALYSVPDDDRYDCI